MNCPACKPDESCSACLAEELARRSQQHNIQKICDAYNGAIDAIWTKHVDQEKRPFRNMPEAKPKKRTKGRPRKPIDERLVSLHVSVHPAFPAHLDAIRSAGRGIAIEKAFGFTRPTTGRKGEA